MESPSFGRPRNNSPILFGIRTGAPVYRNSHMSMLLSCSTAVYWISCTGMRQWSVASRVQIVMHHQHLYSPYTFGPRQT